MQYKLLVFFFRKTASKSNPTKKIEKKSKRKIASPFQSPLFLVLVACDQNDLRNWFPFSVFTLARTNTSARSPHIAVRNTSRAETFVLRSALKSFFFRFLCFPHRWAVKNYSPPPLFRGFSETFEPTFGCRLGLIQRVLFAY